MTPSAGVRLYDVHPMGAASVTPSSQRLLAIIELQNAILAAGLQADDVMRIVTERAATLTSATAAFIALSEGEDLVYRAVVGAGMPDVGGRLPKATTLPGRVIAEHAPLRVDDVTKEPQVTPSTPGGIAKGSLVCVPLLYGEHAVGVLEIVSALKGTFTDEDMETLTLLANIVAISLHRAYTYPRLPVDNMHDPLTGLSNRRAFGERIDAELGRNRRYGHSFSLAIIDLDGLESVTDRHGQATSDQIVRDIAIILKKHTRVIDACFRLAAAEFAIVMPGTSLDGARVLAERFRAQINEARGDLTVTSSFGVVAAAHETSDELLARAIAARDADRAARRG